KLPQYQSNCWRMQRNAGETPNEFTANSVALPDLAHDRQDPCRLTCWSRRFKKPRRHQVERPAAGTTPDLNRGTAPALRNGFHRQALLISQAEILHQAPDRYVIRFADCGDHLGHGLSQQELERLAAWAQLPWMGKRPLLDSRQLAEDREVLQRKPVRR